MPYKRLNCGGRWQVAGTNQDQPTLVIALRDNEEKVFDA
jgi:hypothetical protein